MLINLNDDEISYLNTLSNNLNITKEGILLAFLRENFFSNQKLKSESQNKNECITIEETQAEKEKKVIEAFKKEMKMLHIKQQNIANTYDTSETTVSKALKMTQKNFIYKAILKKPTVVLDKAFYNATQIAYNSLYEEANQIKDAIISHDNLVDFEQIIFLEHFIGFFMITCLEEKWLGQDLFNEAIENFTSIDDNFFNKFLLEIYEDEKIDNIPIFKYQRFQKIINYFSWSCLF